MKHTQSKKHSKSQNRRDSRRSFLRKGVVVSGGLAGAAALPGEALAAAEQAPEQKTQKEGYRLTEHIAEYYKSARL